MHTPSLAVLLVMTACRTTNGEQSANNNRLPTTDGDTSQADTDSQDTGPPPPWGLNQRPDNSTCLASDRPARRSSSVQLSPAFPNLGFYRPTNLVHLPDNDTVWYVTESEGQLLRFEASPDVSTTTVFLDLSERVHSQADGAGEMGVLGLAFHPDFNENGWVFVSYTTQLADGSLASRVSRFESRDGGQTADIDSESVILTLAQPRVNHNGGRLVFGPDGMLWIAFGDGGGHEGRDASDQLDNFYGKLLRIDIDSEAPYAIPPDNPLQAGVAPEAWAWGFRNPWGWNFDRNTGALWLGDVGAAAWEELILVEKGAHYGWPCCEGPDCVTSNRYPTCSAAARQDALYSYDHSEGLVVVAGPTYSGTDIPDLVGTVLFADYMGQWVRGLRFSDAGEPVVETLIEDLGVRISGFAETTAGEVYVLGFNARAQIYRLEAVGLPDETPSNFPERLSETGCFQQDDPTQAVPAMIPYSLNAPFWSDGLDKQRWFAIPNNTQIEVDEQGDWSLPVGSVAAKTFLSDGQPIETRLLMHHEDGDWAGYVYVWSEDDATVVSSGARVSTAEGTHSVPPQWQCLGCHTEAAGRTLGLESAQLARDHTYAQTGRTADQLTTLSHIGVVGQLPESIVPLSSPYAGTADAGRAWLHTNCSMCHRPEADNAATFDLRASTATAEMNICHVAPTDSNLGVDGALRLVPGDPSRSLLYLRPSRDDVWRMPPFGSHSIDQSGLEGVHQWISTVDDCPPPVDVPAAR